MASKSEQPPPYLPEGDNDDTQQPTSLLPTEEEPPAYALEVPISPDDVLAPATFVMRGRFIYPATPSTSSSSSGAAATSPDPSHPAYQLSRKIHMMGTPSGDRHLIEFERVDYKFRTHSRTGSLVQKHRGKSMYKLEYYVPALSMTWQAIAQPMSSRTLGEVEIRIAGLFHTGYRAFKKSSEEEEAYIRRKTGKIPKKEWYFEMKKVDGKQGVWEWRDSEGKLVARQWRDQHVQQPGMDDHEENEYKLEVVTEVSRRVMDSMVALWCLWLWHLHAVEAKPKKSWRDRKELMEKKKPELKGMTLGSYGNRIR
ncbi:hypothetical protein QBC35DRAFT_179559 [Podospora australis]|uniref:Uncharacterized protein n=1 Tax=Podospora australis TaxID=1536484 RepID=A0AAN6WVG5_9PEZI|nr:hypothetical protein QBC35DRAFT_179559 [Podospora australis]